MNIDIHNYMTYIFRNIYKHLYISCISNTPIYSYPHSILLILHINN